MLNFIRNDNYKTRSFAEAMNLIASVFNIPVSQIKGIKNIKLGMTNHSFSFTVDMAQYICRVPGEGTDKLINRNHEHVNIEAVKILNISETVIYHDPKTGYKISEYLTNARPADKSNAKDLRRCMAGIRHLHQAKIYVDHEFNVADEISFYESLCLENGRIPFNDYNIVRNHSLELADKLSSLNRPKTLCHVDCVPDNCLFINNDSELRIIDWEYSGMADPLIDIASFCIYSYFNKSETDKLIGFYFNGVTTSDTEKGIVYAYMALLGLCWALWAVYKEHLGVSFSDYPRIQYRYAVDYYKEAIKLL